MAVEERRWITWLEIHMITKGFFIRTWHSFTVQSFFSCGSFKVMFSGTFYIPKNFIFWMGWRADFPALIKNMTLVTDILKCCFLDSFPPSILPLSKLYFRNIFWHIFNFFNRKMEIFTDFVNNLGAGPIPKYKPTN